MTGHRRDGGTTHQRKDPRSCHARDSSTAARGATRTPEAAWGDIVSPAEGRRITPAMGARRRAAGGGGGGASSASADAPSRGAGGKSGTARRPLPNASTLAEHIRSALRYELASVGRPSREDLFRA